MSANTAITSQIHKKNKVNQIIDQSTWPTCHSASMSRLAFIRHRQGRSVRKVRASCRAAGVCASPGTGGCGAAAASEGARLGATERPHDQADHARHDAQHDGADNGGEE